MPIIDGEGPRGAKSVQTHGQWSVVTPPNEVDPSTSPDLRAVLDDLRASDVNRVAIDWRAVTFFDSSAIGVIMGSHRELTEAGGKMAVICADGSPRRLFDLMGLDQVLTFVTTPEELD